MVSPRNRALVGATFAVLAVLAWIDRRLITAHCPYGIVSFELAWTTERALAIVGDWRALERTGFAAASLLVDVPFLILYASVLVRGCGWVGARRWAGAARVLAGASVVAASLDLLENIALANLLAGRHDAPLAPVAGAAATVKFALGAIVVGFLAAGAIAQRLRR